jgi:hypothetical protein
MCGVGSISVCEAGDQTTPWDIGRAINLPARVRLDMMLVILWRTIYKARNVTVFDCTVTITSNVLHAQRSKTPVLGPLHTRRTSLCNSYSLNRILSVLS